MEDVVCNAYMVVEENSDYMPACVCRTFDDAKRIMTMLNATLEEGQPLYVVEPITFIG